MCSGDDTGNTGQDCSSHGPLEGPLEKSRRIEQPDVSVSLDTDLPSTPTSFTSESQGI